MPPIWPVGLPQIANQPGFTERPPANVARSTLEGAPALARRRSSDEVRRFTQPMILTPAQLDTFDAFLRNDLAGGKLSFDWVNSRTGLAARLKLAARPQYNPVSGGTAWRVGFAFVQVPT